MWLKSKNWFIEHLSGTYGRVWLGIISFTESIFLPVPTDIFMMLVLLMKDNVKRWVHYATITMITSVIGAVVGYIMSFWLFDIFGPPLISVLGLEQEFAKTQSFLESSVFLFTFIGAVTPLPFKVFVLTAGFLKVNFLLFLLASVLGRSVRLYAGAWLVKKYGQHGVIYVKKYTPHITVISLMLLFVYILGYMFL